MAQHNPRTINLADIESAISSAVESAKAQKAGAKFDLSRGPIICGRYLREAALHGEAEQGAKQAAEEITRQVNSKTPELNAKSFVGGGPGGLIIGLVFREE